MTTATGIPEAFPDTVMHPREEPPAGVEEHEPLLGRRGDVSQPEGNPLYHNIFLGEYLNFTMLDQIPSSTNAFTVQAPQS